MSTRTPRKKARATGPARGSRRTKTGKTIMLVRDMSEQQKRARVNAGRKMLTTALKDVPDAYLDCYDRSIGHRWDDLIPLHPIRWKLAATSRVARFSERTMQCERCTTQRTERFRHTAQGLVRDDLPVYAYPDDYKRPGCPRGVRPQQLVWQEKYNRVVSHHGARGQKVANH